MRSYYQAHPPRTYQEERDALITVLLTALFMVIVSLSGSGPVPS